MKSLIRLPVSFLILLILPRIGWGQKDDLTTKDWSDTNKIKIVDFRGYPPPFTPGIISPCCSLTFFTVSQTEQGGKWEVVSELNKSCSWIKANDTAEAKAQLFWTQDVFDLVEVYARMLRKALVLEKFSVENYNVEVEKMYDEYNNKLYHAQADFEQEMHDMGINANIKWENKIHHELDSLKEYKDPFITVSFSK